MKETLELRYPLFSVEYRQYYDLAPDMSKNEIVPYMEHWLAKFTDMVKEVYPEDANLSDNEIAELVCKDLTNFIELRGFGMFNKNR